MVGSALTVMFIGLFAGTTPPPPPIPSTTVDPIIQSAIAEGNVARCSNGTFSDNTDFRATCSSNDGVERWLAPFGACGDGTVIALSEDASCDDHEGFAELLPADFRPTPGEADVALCHNGVFSNNIEFDDTCSSNDGVAVWLAAQGQCRDGTVVEMSEETTCEDHGGFGQLLRIDVARCADGSVSSYIVFADTCRTSGGVVEWLATYGECRDGTAIEMSPAASCELHGGFVRLMPVDFDPAATTVVAPTTTAPALATSSTPAVTALPAATTTAPGSGDPGVGGTDTSGDLSFTVNTFEDPVTDANEFLGPEPGNRFVAVEVTITNMSEDMESFSTLLFAELIDSQNQSWDVSIFGLSDRPGLDVEIPPGESRRGWIAFEVPESSMGFRLRLKGNITAQGAVFTLS